MCSSGQVVLGERVRGDCGDPVKDVANRRGVLACHRNGACAHAVLDSAEPSVEEVSLDQSHLFCHASRAAGARIITGLCLSFPRNVCEKCELAGRRARAERTLCLSGLVLVRSLAKGQISG